MNFNENIGIGEINKNESRNISITRNPGLAKILLKNKIRPDGYAISNGIDPINIALAGVGSPIKLSVCLWSILNFARRKAENTGIRKETKGI